MASIITVLLVTSVTERDPERNQGLLTGKKVGIRKKQYVTYAGLEVFIIRKW
jgi:hypothetical protein